MEKDSVSLGGSTDIWKRYRLEEIENCLKSIDIESVNKRDFLSLRFIGWILC